MHSTLIRYTSSKYVDSYLSGNLYLSSLSSFWDFMAGKIVHDEPITEEKVRDMLSGVYDSRQDFSEGVIAQIPRDKVPILSGDFQNHVIHDVRFRLNAYKYCNLLCFFRIDAIDGEKGLLDEDNLSFLLKDFGIKITAEEIRSLNNRQEVHKLVDLVIENNPVLSVNQIHMIQLPSLEMNRFGDCVIVIKNEEEFKRRVIAAVEREGEHCILGDVRYHDLVDRVDPGTMSRNSVTLISSEGHNIESDNMPWLSGNGTFNMSILDGVDDIIWRGCLDKYSRYAAQREWRICWLPREHNYEAKTLSVGSLEDIIDVVDAKDIRRYLLKMYRGYTPGIIDTIRRDTAGTTSYKAFKERMKEIDGTGDFIFEIG